MKAYAGITTHWERIQDDRLRVEGVKHDAGKPDFSLLPPRAIEAMVRVLTFGAKQYSPDNWRKVPQLQRRYIAAMLRHIFAYMRGEKVDAKTGENHLAHVMCNAAFLLELYEEDINQNA